MGHEPIDDAERLTDGPVTPLAGAPDPRTQPGDRPSLGSRLGAARGRAEELRRRAEDRFDQERRRRTWLETVWQSLLRMYRRGGPLLSGGLAYRIFLWELPMALVVVAILGLFTDVSGYSADQLAHDAGMGAALAATIGQAVSQTDASSWWLLLIGFVLTLWAARSAVSALRLIHRIAWDQPIAAKTSPVWPPLIFTGIMLVAIVGSAIAGRAFGGGAVVTVVQWLLAVVLTALIVTFAMVLLPRAGRPWPAVLPGALLFTLVVRAMTVATDVYFAGKLDRVDDLYGSLGIAIVMLLWLYLLAWGWIAATFINAGLGGITGERPVVARGADMPAAD